MIDTRPSPDTQQTTAYRSGGRPTAEKQMTEKCQIARDKMTGFPCIRKGQEGSFVALLPVTKLQVEQWIASGGFRPDSPDKVGFLLDRLETPYRRSANPKVADVYPNTAKRLNRVAVQKCTRDDWEGLLATNLSIWSGSEIIDDNMGFPTDTSEWGQFLNWCRGSLPSGRCRYYAADEFSILPTRQLVTELIARAGDSSRPAVECLLRTVQSCLTDADRGLPFMNLGLYELLSDTDTIPRLTGEVGHLTRPYVGGECAIWPSLQPRGTENWRVVYHNVLPVVALRLWFDPEDVEDVRTIQVPSPECRGAEESVETSWLPAAAREPRAVQHRFARPLRRQSRVTMECRCPVCSKKLETSVFQNDLSLWHWKQLVESDQNESATESMHGNAYPSGVMGASDIEGIHQEYLRIARQDPSKVRSICLSGPTKSGKTTWLVSLAGMMSYPTNKPMLREAFPLQGKFKSTLCSMQGFTSGADGSRAHDIHGQLEGMWVLGDLPSRTDEHNRPLRCCLKFGMNRPGLLWSRPDDLVLVFNDIAGETTTNPNSTARLAGDNQIFSHVGSSTDIIFVIPAEDINEAGAFLRQFTNALGGVNYEGSAIHAEDINLIVAISQIDLLRHAGRRNRQLLDILLCEPYIWPDSPADLGDYVSTMREVHFRIEDYLQRNVGAAVDAAGDYRSVRYCGCSAFGFRPVMNSREHWSQSFLPFKPQPVRVVDPLLWLLVDNGLMSPRRLLGISDWR